MAYQIISKPWPLDNVKTIMRNLRKNTQIKWWILKLHIKQGLNLQRNFDQMTQVNEMHSTLSTVYDFLPILPRNRNWVKVLMQPLLEIFLNLVTKMQLSTILVIIRLGETKDVQEHHLIINHLQSHLSNLSYWCKVSRAKLCKTMSQLTILFRFNTSAKLDTWVI